MAGLSSEGLVVPVEYSLTDDVVAAAAAAEAINANGDSVSAESVEGAFLVDTRRLLCRLKLAIDAK